MNIKTVIFSTAIAGIMMTAGGGEQEASALVPEVKSVTMSQAADRRVTVKYMMDNAPAVVTLDIQTNCIVNGETRWTSIGGQAICNAKGTVWRKVMEDDAIDGVYTITWRPDLSWPNHKIAAGGARAVVTAWALDNTPDYMVVDISAAAKIDSQNYYPSADFLPGGLLGNADYRTSTIVMRKIMAKDVTWTMGSTALEEQREKSGTTAYETVHRLTLTNNFYIGVFEVTQAQWSNIYKTKPSHFNNPSDRAMRPVEKVSFSSIRNAANTVNEWPAAPASESFLGLLRGKTGIDFDLPSEAQWEFAARAGNGDTKWGDGSGIQNTDADTNLDNLGRYKYNGGMVGTDWTEPSATCEARNGTSIAGSYDQNDWGLYDMHGNVWEWCLDWWKTDISTSGGEVNLDSSSGYRIIRGGCYNVAAASCRSACRYISRPETATSSTIGFRVTCTAGLR